MRPLDEPVSVSVNGLAAEVNRVPNSATSNGNKTLAWRLPNLPLLLGPNEYEAKVCDGILNYTWKDENHRSGRAALRRQKFHDNH